MTDTDRIDQEADGDRGVFDDALEDWDEYSDDEGVYEDFLDWLDGQT